MVSPKAALACLGVLLLRHLQPCHAYPSPNISDYSHSLDARQEVKDFYLRIMPLGASITAGEHAEGDDPNGYRKFLRDKLRSEGWKVNMVGTKNRPGMRDGDHEGVSGDRVSEVTERADNAVFYWLPNVVLINAGTNDATQNGAVEPVAGTGTRMRELIDTVFRHVPTAVVVLSTLLPNDSQDNVDIINDEYRRLYREYVPLDEDGNEDPEPAFKVILADMADGFITKAHIHDGTHPTVEGNRRMAAVWDWAINTANQKGWLSPPSDSGRFQDGEGSTNCRKEYGSGNHDDRAGRQVLYASNSVIRDDGTYKHGSRPRNDRQGSWEGDQDTRVWFAQLVNHGAPKLGERDEVIYVTGNSVDRLIKIKINDGDGVYNLEHTIDVKDGCLTRGIHWGDVNGDGLDDFICIARDGEMFVSLNQGGNPPTFKNLGSYKKPEMGLGQDHVRLGDIDGDGRLDYCVIPGYGDIFCWRNGGLGEKAAYWQDMGSGSPVFKAKGMGDIMGVRFVDLNGDGRDDWIWMDRQGKITTYINQRGEDKGMIPRWLSAGQTHLGMGVEIGEKREHVTFGRIFGDNGRQDYVHWTTDCSGNSCDGTWLAYENQGSGGRFQKGDGIYWGDMTGTGVDDYIWIAPEGEVNVFLNKNTKERSDYYDTPAWSSPRQLNTGLDRRALHIGDWDGDGKADVIGITDRNTGSLRVWYSRFDGNEFNWEMEDVPDSAKCNQGWGLLYFDHGAHFADITGSGRVDYICMEPSGLTRAWLRDEDGGWFNAGQVKFTEDLDRANFRFADADGDGRADLIWTDKFSGDARVWYNLGQKQESDRPALGGSLFEWERPSTVYLGSSRGPNMYFPELGGQGRADMVGTNPTTGHAWIWFNSCPAGGDDPQSDADEVPDYTPRPIEPGPIDPDDHWFCGGNGGTWTLKKWNEHNVGRWLVQRCEMYIGIDANWPTDVDGVPRVIAQYNGLVRDNAWNWPGPGCVDIADTCDLSEDHLTESPCENTPQRAFALWSMRNYARFMQRWYDIFMDSVDTASLFTGSITTTFFSHPEPETPDTAAWLGIAAGMFTTVGAFLTGPLGVGVNAMSGILGTAGAAAGLAEEDPEDDPTFDDFASLQEKLGKMKLVVGEAMTSAFNRFLVDTPPDDDWDRGTELARMMANGAFVDQDFATGDDAIDPETMVEMIQASIISEAWNAGQVAIIKWSRDGDMATRFGFNPCFGGERFGTDHAVACQFDKNYMIARVLSNDVDGSEQAHIYTWPLVGQEEKTLENYSLNHAKVIRAAERTQERTNSFKPRGLNGLSSLFQYAIDNPSGNVLDDLIYFNIPVCDLDRVGDFFLHDNCQRPDLLGERLFKQCLAMTIAVNCSKMRQGDSEWPYQFSI